jgi:hypothetical protein
MRRTGYEPTQARSPLRLRLGLAVFGVLSGIGAAVGFAVNDEPGWAALCAAIAALAAANCAVVVRHIRQGARYQPGRDVPPYRLPERQGRKEGEGREKYGAHGRGAGHRR